MPTPSNATPTEITIIVSSHTKVKVTIDGESFWEYILYINGQNYVKLPLDANVREPNPAKSKPYKDMKETLQNSPQDFLENNLGISAIASSIDEMGNNRFRIRFDSGTGILNGGHTQQAILDTNDDPNTSKALVRLIIREKEYQLERIAEIASAQNSTTAVKEYSLAEKKGLFAALKAKMDPNKSKSIIWYEGQQVPNNIGMEASDLIALINMFNVSLYKSNLSPREDSQPTDSVSSKGSVLKKWEKSEYFDSFKMVYPLVDDILDLYEDINLTLTDKTGITSLNLIRDKKGKGKKLPFSGRTPEYDIAKQFYLPIMAAFRANVFVDEENRTIGWHMDNKELLKRTKKKLCDRVKNELKQNTINTVGKSSNLYELLYSSVENEINKEKKYKVYAY